MMQGLRFSSGSCVSVWIYCIVWFLFQDACKVYSYQLWDKMTGAHDGMAGQGDGGVETHDCSPRHRAKATRRALKIAFSTLAQLKIST